MMQAWLKSAGFGVCALSLGVWASTSLAQQRLEVGTAAPVWEKLTGTDERQHSLADLQEYDFVVLCFTCNNCPYAIDYEDRLIELHRRFAKADPQRPYRAAVVAINSNDTPDDQLAKMRERAAARGLEFPYLRDADQAVAKAYHALYTPEFFVLDRERKLRYQGALDDSTQPEDVRHTYVIDALEALAVGREPSLAYVGARGCKIRFSKPKRTL